MGIGKKTWVFADGDLPPQGKVKPFGHEALIIVNDSKTTANIELKFYFEDKDPVSNIHIIVESQRVKCFRMDSPVGIEKFKIPFGQYALILHSNIPVVCLYGRLDRRENMAYYPIGGFSE